jgi:hypothetical protein
VVPVDLGEEEGIDVLRAELVLGDEALRLLPAVEEEAVPAGHHHHRGRDPRRARPHHLHIHLRRHYCTFFRPKVFFFLFSLPHPSLPRSSQSSVEEINQNFVF